jgi:diacylglycerol kinase family enzyme
VAEDVSGLFGAVVVANVGRLIFGSITHSASPSDGKLNVIATRPRRRIGWLWAVSLYVMHRYESCSRVSRLLAKSLQLRSSADRVPIHADGEPVGNLPVQIRVAPGSVVLLAPPERNLVAGQSFRESTSKRMSVQCDQEEWGRVRKN